MIIKKNMSNVTPNKTKLRAWYIFIPVLIFILIALFVILKVISSARKLGVKDSYPTFDSMNLLGKYRTSRKFVKETKVKGSIQVSAKTDDTKTSEQ